MSLRSASFALLLMVCDSAPAAAQARGATPPNPAPPAADSTPKVETAGEKEEKISKTTHTLRLDGHDIKYTATTGTLPIRLDNGQVAAHVLRRMTKDGDDAKRGRSSFLYSRARRRDDLAAHGIVRAGARGDGRRGLSAGAPYPGGQREFAADIADMVFVDAVDTDTAARSQRRQQAVPRRPR
jgi:hypothetical protein